MLKIPSGPFERQLVGGAEECGCGAPQGLPRPVRRAAYSGAAFDVLERSYAGTVRAAVRKIRVSDAKQAVGPGVHLLNAHTGKGRQFDWVFVVGFEEGHLPDRRNSEGATLLEEQRVLLVMLSRARHGLVVTRSLMNDGRYGPYPAKQNRWWPGLRTQFTSVEHIEAYLTSDWPVNPERTAL